MTKKKEIIYPVIDFGHGKIRVLIATCEKESGRLKILGCGVSENLAMKNGRITDFQTATQSLRSAYEEAEKSSGWRIN